MHVVMLIILLILYVFMDVYKESVSFNTYCSCGTLSAMERGIRVIIRYVMQIGKFDILAGFCLLSRG